MKHASEFDENKASSRLIKVCEQHYQVEKVRNTKNNVYLRSFTKASFQTRYNHLFFSKLVQNIHHP